MPVRVRTQKERLDHFIAAWREHRNLSQYQLAALIGTSPANLSRVETKKQPYTQDMLEAIASILKVAPAALIGQDPADPAGIWDVWSKASATQRQQIADVARTLTKIPAVA